VASEPKRLSGQGGGLRVAADRRQAYVKPSHQKGAGVNAREPILNVPAVIVAILAVLVVIHAVRVFFLSTEAELEVLLLFAFIPGRYSGQFAGMLPGGLPGDIWTFFTYSLLHADLTHLALNGVWLLAFGTPLARRFGALRFTAFFLVTAAAGALVHLLVHRGQLVPVIGASAVVSGTMAAAIRFAFQQGGPLAAWRGEQATYDVPAAPLSQALRDRRIVLFLVVWFGLNLLFGLTSWTLTGAEQPVAWEAHIGGFLAGLLLFAVFDPVPAAGRGSPPTQPSAL
jgi:membrane associated rhomboid family serine protease